MKLLTSEKSGHEPLNLENLNSEYFDDTNLRF